MFDFNHILKNRRSEDKTKNHRRTFNWKNHLSCQLGQHCVRTLQTGNLSDQCPKRKTNFVRSKLVEFARSRRDGASRNWEKSRTIWIKEHLTFVLKPNFQAQERLQKGFHYLNTVLILSKYPATTLFNQIVACCKNHLCPQKLVAHCFGKR